MNVHETCGLAHRTVSETWMHKWMIVGYHRDEGFGRVGMRETQGRSWGSVISRGGKKDCREGG